MNWLRGTEPPGKHGMIPAFMLWYLTKTIWGKQRWLCFRLPSNGNGWRLNFRDSFCYVLRSMGTWRFCLSCKTVRRHSKTHESSLGIRSKYLCSRLSRPYFNSQQFIWGILGSSHDCTGDTEGGQTVWGDPQMWTSEDRSRIPRVWRQWCWSSCLQRENKSHCGMTSCKRKFIHSFINILS